MDEWFERSPFVGFAPWIIYWVVADGPSTWMFGAICAVIAALTLGVSAGRGGPRLLEVVTVVFFVAVTIAGMVVGAEDRDWMDTYATTLSSGVLAADVAGVAGVHALHPQYAPESAPQQDWEKPAFRRTNQVLTLMWALVFALIAVWICRRQGAVHRRLDQGGDSRRGDRRGDRDDADLSRPGTGERQTALTAAIICV